MTNKERIYKLCGCVNDLIDILSYYDNIGFNFRRSLERVKNSLIDILEDIEIEE